MKPEPILGDQAVGIGADQSSHAESLVVLVDSDDNEVGQLAKLDAHLAPGHLHRAFSVFATDRDGRLLMQRRAATKYHFGGLWTNTCCSHPLPGEQVVDAAVRRTREEFGLVLGQARSVGAFTYRAVDAESGLVEHEYDTVVSGTVEGDPSPNPGEIDEFRWIDRASLDRWLVSEPDRFTPWFSLALAALDAGDGGREPR